MDATLQETKVSSFRADLKHTSLAFAEEKIKQAETVLGNIDFPTTRQEAWKYTRVGKIAALKASSIGTNKVDENGRFQIDSNAIRIILQNGKLHTGTPSELPKGLTVKPMSECTREELALSGAYLELNDNIFNSLNTLYASEGVYINIEKNTVLEQPIEVIHIQNGTEQVAHIRHLIVAGSFCKAEINQVYVSDKATNCLTNSITECFVGENAHLTINKLQNEQEGNFAVLTEQIAQEKDSFFQINTLTLDGSWVRNNINAEVNGVNCTTNLYGAYILKDNQHVDNHTMIDHKAPHCNSNELYKGVMDDKSTGVFNGKVFVRKDSQKINAFQSNGNVLLSDSATINSKPELEIYADDVKCSHGSTTGQLDEEAVFYLRARGLSERSARNLMVSAFIGDVLNHIEQEAFLDKTREILKSRFGWDL
jgi:Fe-S cluster assembly protein SufD